MRDKKQLLGSCWLTKESDCVFTYSVQVSFTNKKRTLSTLKEQFSDWILSGVGYDPNKKETIHIYKKSFSTKQKFNKIKKMFSFEIQLT